MYSLSSIILMVREIGVNGFFGAHPVANHHKGEDQGRKNHLEIIIEANNSYQP